GDSVAGFALFGPVGGIAEEIFFVVLAKAALERKIGEPSGLRERKRAEAGANCWSKAGDQNQEDKGRADRSQTEARATRYFVESAQSFLLIKAVPCCIRESAPAMAEKFQGRLPRQASGFSQEMQPVPDFAIPFLVPGRACGFGNKQAGKAQNDVALPHQSANLWVGLHNFTLPAR